MEGNAIEVVGFNTECDLYYTYLQEYYHGLTSLDFDEWLDEFYDSLHETFDYDVFNIDEEENNN